VIRCVCAVEADPVRVCGGGRSGGARWIQHGNNEAGMGVTSVLGLAWSRRLTRYSGVWGLWW
jgi:hypothetical protein